MVEHKAWTPKSACRHVVRRYIYIETAAPTAVLYNNDGDGNNRNRSWKFGTALVSEEEILRAEFVGKERISPVTGEKER